MNVVTCNRRLTIAYTARNMSKHSQMSTQAVVKSAFMITLYNTTLLTALEEQRDSHTNIYWAYTHLGSRPVYECACTWKQIAQGLHKQDERTYPV